MIFERNQKIQPNFTKIKTHNPNTRLLILKVDKGEEMSTANWNAYQNGYGFRESKIPKSKIPNKVGNQPPVDKAPPNRRYVKYVPVGYADTHSKTVGYLFWLVGFTGAHRFYYGKTKTGILWFFTFGLLGVGWLIDFFLIPWLDAAADRRFAPGITDYTLAWVLLVFGGIFGVHRFVQGRWVTGVLYLLSGGLIGLGVVYDVLTMNQQIDQRHREFCLPN